MRRGPSAGFTMVELIIVMTVMGVLAAVAMPRLTDRRALQERGLLDQLRGFMQLSRKVALAQRRGVCVILAPADVRAIFTTPGGACNPADPVSEPGSTSPFVIAVPAGIALGGAAQVRFDRDGKPSPNVNHAISVGGNGFTVSRETGIVF